jgi:hypothetical protein
MTHDHSSAGTAPHLGVDQLGDYHDGLLPAAEHAAAAAHLARCAGCASRLAELHRLLERAGAAPPSIDPPRDLWPAVRARLGRRGAAAVTEHPGWARRWWPAAAAAAALVALSSAVTVRIVGGGPGDVSPPAAAAPPDERPVPRYEVLEAHYARTAAQLAAAVDAERGTLAPETVATVERSLRTIDAAIAEARAALARDPHNPALVQLFSASYEQKLTLLKRAAELPSQL